MCGQVSRSMSANFAPQDRFLTLFFGGPLAEHLYKMLGLLPWDEIKSFFQALARRLLTRIKPD